MLNVSDLQTDGQIKYLSYSAQTALNLFSSTIQTISTFNATGYKNEVVPWISFQWTGVSQTVPITSSQ
jgi:hypothetical protein